jgi:hypothetical protein
MFRELYYWMYLTLKKIKTNDTPAINAYFLICLLQGLNIETLVVVITYLLKINIATERNSAIYIGLGLSVVLFIVNYFLLYAQRKNIFEQCENISQERKTKGKVYFCLYILLSLAIFFIVVANLVTPRY